jgi:hypothetical protein
MMTTSLAVAFRLAIAARALALLAQATLAGLALSGRGTIALAAHMLVGGTIFVISAAQVVLVLLLWRVAQAPGWLIVVSAGVMAADGLQMASGRSQIFALHLPLGAGLFGASIALGIWAWISRSSQSAAQSQSKNAPLTFRERNLEKKL